MKGFRDSLLSVIDSSAKRAKDLVNSIGESIDNFDWDDQFDYLNEKKNALFERGNSLLKDFGELLKQVKESFNDFSVTVPFDESIGEKLDFSVDGNKLKVVVTYEDETSSRSNETVVVIPANCDVNKVSKVVNSVTKTATISMPKVITPGEEKEKEADAATRTAKKRLSPKRPATAGKPKVKRAANGRFVKAGE
jgi:hypothetical protein